MSPSGDVRVRRRFPSVAMETAAGVVSTDAGMHMVWDPAHFPGVHDYDTWEVELLEDDDIAAHIRQRHVVPINIGADGAWAIVVAAEAESMPRLTEDEQRRVVVASEPYLLAVPSGRVCVGGIEHVEATPPDETLGVVVPAGLYDVRVYLMDYDDIADKTNDHPDFIVLMGPASADRHRVSVTTFDRPD